MLAAVAWSVVVALPGGLGCGWCVSVFGELGALSLVACGMAAGYVSRKLTRQASKPAAISQAIGMAIAFFVAETCWLHWNTFKGEPSWWDAVSVWPLFIREYKLSAVIGAACMAYGAWYAYSYAAGHDDRAAMSGAQPILPPPSSP